MHADPRPARTRERALRAARRLIETRGFRGLGLATIAAEADVSRQALYLHFGSRTGLLLALVAWVDEQEGLPELAAPIDRAATGEEALERYVDLVVALTPRVAAVSAALEAARDDPAAGRAWGDRVERRRKRCAGVVRRLAREGRLAPGLTTTTATDILWVLTARATWSALVDDRGWSADRFRHETLRLARHGLLA